MDSLDGFCYSSVPFVGQHFISDQKVNKESPQIYRMIMQLSFQYRSSLGCARWAGSYSTKMYSRSRRCKSQCLGTKTARRWDGASHVGCETEVFDCLLLQCGGEKQKCGPLETESKAHVCCRLMLTVLHWNVALEMLPKSLLLRS